MNFQGIGHDRDGAVRPQAVPSREPARPDFPGTFHCEPANDGHDGRAHSRKIAILSNQENGTPAARKFAEKIIGLQSATSEASDPLRDSAHEEIEHQTPSAARQSCFGH